MLITSKARLAATVVALLCAPAVSTAAMTSDDLGASSSATDSLAPSYALPLDFAATSQLRPASQLTVDALGATAEPMAHALGGSEFGNLRGNADLLLWNLCATVRTQQGHQYFERIETSVRTQKISEDISKVSAVPLPGAVWLFVIGVLGLAGSRITGVKAARKTRTAVPGAAALLS